MFLVFYRESKENVDLREIMDLLASKLVSLYVKEYLKHNLIIMADGNII